MYLSSVSTNLCVDPIATPDFETIFEITRFGPMIKWSYVLRDGVIEFFCDVSWIINLGHLFGS